MQDLLLSRPLPFHKHYERCGIDGRAIIATPGYTYQVTADWSNNPCNQTDCILLTFGSTPANIRPFPLSLSPVDVSLWWATLIASQRSCPEMAGRPPPMISVICPNASVFTMLHGSQDDAPRHHLSALCWGVFAARSHLLPAMRYIPLESLELESENPGVYWGVFILNLKRVKLWKSNCMSSVNTFETLAKVLHELFTSCHVTFSFFINRRSLWLD